MNAVKTTILVLGSIVGVALAMAAMLLCPFLFIRPTTTVDRGAEPSDLNQRANVPPMPWQTQSNVAAGVSGYTWNTRRSLHTASALRMI